MSQVQPPRSRPSNARPATIQILRWIFLNLGAVVVTALLVRIAILIAVPDTPQSVLKDYLRITHIAVGPLLLLPPLDTALGGGFTVADLIVLVMTIVVWIAVIGVLSGWERESQRMGAATSD